VDSFEKKLSLRKRPCGLVLSINPCSWVVLVLRGGTSRFDNSQNVKMRIPL
jgi:hypothetical protein